MTIHTVFKGTISMHDLTNKGHRIIHGLGPLLHNIILLIRQEQYQHLRHNENMRFMMHTSYEHMYQKCIYLPYDLEGIIIYTRAAPMLCTETVCSEEKFVNPITIS